MRRLARPSLGFLFLACAALFAGSAWMLQSDPLLACQSRRLQLERTAEESSGCERDSDCALLTRGCGPLATCGLPVRADVLGSLEKAVKAFEEECPGYGGLQCVSCVALAAKCVESRCVAAEVREPPAFEEPAGPDR